MANNVVQIILEIPNSLQYYNINIRMNVVPVITKV